MRPTLTEEHEAWRAEIREFLDAELPKEHAFNPEFDDAPRQIVGIVGNVREVGIREGIAPVMYLPQAQQPEGMTKLIASVLPTAWAVRSAADRAYQNDRRGSAPADGTLVLKFTDCQNIAFGLATDVLCEPLDVGRITEGQFCKLRDDVMDDLCRRALCRTGHPPEWSGLADLEEDIRDQLTGL